MLTQLSTLKARLELTDDPQYDPLLTQAIAAISGRFDRECGRTLARVENAAQEFAADELEICPAGYPIEAVTRFELKSSESEGCVEQSNPEFLIRHHSVISLSAPLGTSAEQARVIYTGGYVAPGTSPGPGQTPLPADLEQAALEQVVFWFQNRDRVGVIRAWPKSGIYEQFLDIDLLPAVRSVLAKYVRW